MSGDLFSAVLGLALAVGFVISFGLLAHECGEETNECYVASLLCA